MSTEITDLRQAFSLLVDTVDGLVNEGKVAATAGVKPAMQRRSYGAFDERRLGFATFREFIDAAASEGLVSVTHHGPGITHLATTTRTTAATGRLTTTRRRIRDEIWDAFFDWHKPNRYWDAQHQRVVDAAEPDGRFYAITPIRIEQQVEWMREFAENLDDPMAVALRAVLDSPRPAQAFAALLSRTDRHVQSQWVARRLDLVAQHIKDWADSHGLEVPVWDDFEGSETTKLRALLHRALDAVPDDQLHLVALPASAVITVTG